MPAVCLQEFGLFLAVVALGVILQNAAGAENDRKTMSELERAYQELQEKDSFQVFAAIESTGTSQEVAVRYHKLLKQIYSQKKDVARMGLVGRAGIHYSLSEASKVKDRNPELAAELTGLAKTIAYDVAANSWPGWQDEGVTITPTDLAVGLDCARLNLRLAKELQRDAEVLGNAHWLLGAQLVAADKCSEAEAEFQTAAQRFQDAKKPDYEEMARGYVVIAQLKTGKANERAQRELANRITTLRKLETDDAKFFADQLEQVSAFFLNSAQNSAR